MTLHESTSVCILLGVVFFKRKSYFKYPLKSLAIISSNKKYFLITISFPAIFTAWSQKKVLYIICGLEIAIKNTPTDIVLLKKCFSLIIHLKCALSCISFLRSP